MPQLADTYLRGDRLTWRAAPDAVREWIAARAGEPVLEWQDRQGGMSTGLATVAHGERRSVFVKALDATENPEGGGFYRREAAFAASLPDLAAIPRLLDHGELVADGHEWVVIMYPAVDGGPPAHPWRPDQLSRVLDAWLPVQRALATVGWPRRDSLVEQFTGWRAIADRPEDVWHRYAADWVDREARFVAAMSEGGPLIGAHIDLRADNILLGADQVWFVDWAHPNIAPAWFDPLILFCDAVASGAERGDGGTIDLLELWSRHPACRQAGAELLIDGVAAFAAFMHVAGQKPTHPALPHGRTWQARIADRALPFALRHR